MHRSVEQRLLASSIRGTEFGPGERVAGEEGRDAPEDRWSSITIPTRVLINIFYCTRLAFDTLGSGDTVQHSIALMEVDSSPRAAAVCDFDRL